MQHPAAKNLFKEELEYYAREKQATDSHLIPRILAWLKNKKFKRKITVCEFGGGAGQLLSVVANHFSNATFINAEIVPEYQDRLVSKKITFQLRSILDSGFSDHSFDVIIIRDVLHHLVGRNYRETMYNQQKALSELKRLICYGGVIFIEEITNGSETVAKLLYFLTKLNNTLRVKFSRLYISPHGHIAFFTPQRLSNLVNEIFGKSYKCFFTLYPVPAEFASRLVHFFQPIQKKIIIIQVPKKKR